MEHGRILDLFARALDLPETERERFLDEQHIEDGAARAELSSLLSLASPARSFLEDPVFRISPQESAARVRCLNATDSDRHSRALPLRVDDTRARDVVRAEESIDGLRIVSKLGSGGMGVVYLAEQSAPIRRRVALKLMRLGVEDDESRLRFRLECQALALMDHPSIARVHDAGTTADGRPYLTMEYVPGTAIDRYCDERRLSIAARLRLFLQVCEGVQHAHHVGIVHRDLKPSNILVRDDHGAPSPKIIDFGVAKATVQGLTEQSLHTSPGSSIGTPDYMSPEQATSAGRDVDSRTDVYALGVVLYQLLVGRLPHEFHARPRSTWGAIERALADEEPPLPSRALASLGERANEVASRRSTALGALRRAVSGDLGFVVAKAIEKERARRYSTVSELAAELRRYLGNEPVLASPPSSVYRARKFVRRNKHWVALFAVLVLGLAGTVRMTFVVAAARDRADESLAVAREQAAYTLPLSDAARLADLRAQLGVLWPPRAERVPALDECLVVAGDLVSRRAQHALLLERVSGTADAPRGARVFPWMSARERESYARMVGELVRGLDELVDPRTPIGGITEIERRRDFARDLERDSLLEAAALWREAIESIADAQECPRYGGLALAPQLGLIPIGRDEQSGLWEFAHLQTGAPPRRDETGAIVPSEDMGLVLVLIPGGSFDMGAERQGGAGSRLAINVDPQARPEEGPVHCVRLDACFLSKYEMTQAQWTALAGTNPVLSQPGFQNGAYSGDLRHPVAEISWDDANEMLARADLELPTEAQWEYAARAGTTTPWWTGGDKASLLGAANIYDVSCAKLKPWRLEDDIDDGFALSAPVGSFRANPFGLFDVHGNVWEWTRDRLDGYECPERDGNGERIAAEASGLVLRVCRGGAWDASSPATRVARRAEFSAPYKSTIGVRPARGVDG